MLKNLLLCQIEDWFNSMTESNALFCPPSPTNRLFLGGLSNSVTNNALTSLLQPFGDVVKLDRNPSGFAHLTLLAESKNLDKCVNALNCTKWRGTDLRVERAREHFLHHLQQEWKENDDTDICKTAAISSLNEHQNGDTKPTAPVPIRFSWKGRHIQFSENDDVSSEDSEPIVSRKNSQKAQCIDQGIVPEKSRQPQPRPRTRPTAVMSTLQLFGLPSIAPPSTDVATMRDVSTQNGTTEDRSERSDLKRGRITSSDGANTQSGQKKKLKLKHGKKSAGMDISKACAVEKDVNLIDLSSERVAALAILSDMFDSDGVARDALNGDCKPDVYEVDDNINVEIDGGTGAHSGNRRLALFRKLVPPSSPQHEKHDDEKLIVDTSATRESKPDLQYRRNGLFRRLASAKQ